MLAPPPLWLVSAGAPVRVMKSGSVSLMSSVSAKALSFW
jgi:hypothetical protein